MDGSAAKYGHGPAGVKVAARGEAEGLRGIESRRVPPPRAASPSLGTAAALLLLSLALLRLGPVHARAASPALWRPGRDVPLRAAVVRARGGRPCAARAAPLAAGHGRRSRSPRAGLSCRGCWLGVRRACVLLVAVAPRPAGLSATRRRGRRSARGAAARTRRRHRSRPAGAAAAAPAPSRLGRRAACAGDGHLRPRAEGRGRLELVHSTTGPCSGRGRPAARRSTRAPDTRAAPPARPPASGTGQGARLRLGLAPPGAAAPLARRS